MSWHCNGRRRDARPQIEASLQRKSAATHVFVCGLKGMESGVEEALGDVCRAVSLNWCALRSAMQTDGRLQIEPY
jgi:benzoyl-CoA 2,3-epoxidase subunit A